jgi:enoyl-CoA hydratase
MCDLIVAADDALFSNPVLRMTGAGVELLVEPWELGIRKAKEFLWTGDALDAHEAWRLGLVNRVVARKRLAAETLALAERIALVPPVTASLVKESLNQTAALMGKEHAWRYHFMVHQFMHGTKTAADALRARGKTGSMKRMLAERDRPFARPRRRR